MSKEKKNNGIYRLLWRVIALDMKLKMKDRPAQAVLVIALSLISSLLYALQIPAMERFIETLTKAIGGAGIEMVYLPAIMLGAVIAVSNITESMMSYYNSVNVTRIRTDLTEIVMEELAKKEPICFENPETMDAIEKAKRGVNQLEDICQYMMTRFPQMFATLIVLTVYLGQKSLILGILTPLIFLPLFLGQKLLKNEGDRAEQERAPVSRASAYCRKCLTDRELFKETRLLGAFGYFYRRMKEHIREFCRIDRRLVLRKSGISMAANAVSLAGYAALLIVMLFEMSAGHVSAAALAATFSALLSVYQSISYVMLNMGEIIGGSLPMTENVFKVFELPERKGKSVRADGLKGVKLENVRFRYPGAENEAVRGVTLDIAPRETIAIVGENGAGKTTLVRLLTGLYLPTEGSVEIGGENTGEIDMQSAFSNVSAVFQKYMKYRMSLKDNVQLSDPDHDRDIASPLSQAGLPVDSDCFPEKGDTMLSREFGGVDLSGGQWQRVAIARGLYRAHGMIVLDEPTAAIDPLEETRVYQKFAELAKDKTAVIVTHRMGSARIADRIIVMKDGVIDDVGTHDALMKKGGEYARMVQAQADWYTA